MKNLCFFIVCVFLAFSSCSTDNLSDSPLMSPLPTYDHCRLVGPCFGFQVLDKDGEDWIKKNKTVPDPLSSKEVIKGFNYRVLVDGTQISEGTSIPFNVSATSEEDMLCTTFFYDYNLYALTIGDNYWNGFDVQLEISNVNLWPDGSWHSLYFHFYRENSTISGKPIYEKATIDGIPVEVHSSVNAQNYTLIKL